MVIVVRIKFVVLIQIEIYGCCVVSLHIHNLHIIALFRCVKCCITFVYKNASIF